MTLQQSTGLCQCVCLFTCDVYYIVAYGWWLLFNDYTSGHSNISPSEAGSCTWPGHVTWRHWDADRPTYHALDAAARWVVSTGQ